MPIPDFMANIRKIGAEVVGMSSVGPAVVAITEAKLESEIVQKAQQVFRDPDIITTSVNNTGS